MVEEDRDMSAGPRSTNPDSIHGELRHVVEGLRTLRTEVVAMQKDMQRMLLDNERQRGRLEGEADVRIQVREMQVQITELEKAHAAGKGISEHLKWLIPTVIAVVSFVLGLLKR